jgi:hypothetical protein
MDQVQSPIVKAALAQKALYESEENFGFALDFVDDTFKLSSKETLDVMVNKFLTGRKIKVELTPEKLAPMPHQQIRLFSETFHFARKFFTTSYDADKERLNPIPLIQNVFDALAASDN